MASVALFLSVVLVALLPGDTPSGGFAGKETPKRSYYAAVFLNRSHVSVGASSNIGLYRRSPGDTAWSNIYRPNLFVFGIGMWTNGAVRRFYIAGGNGLHRSENGGVSWRILTDWKTEEVLSLALDPVDSARLYIATPFGIFRSDDDGRTWHKKMRGMARSFVQKVILDRSDRKTLFACSEDDLYRSTDEGEHWTPLRVGVSGIMTVAQNPENPRHLLVGTEDKGVRVSLDGGSTWQRGGGLPEATFYAVSFSLNRSILYAGGYLTGLWKSLDGGVYWKPAWQNGDLEAIYTIFVHPDEPRHLMVGTSGQGVYESFDEGGTWRQAGLAGCHVKQIEFYP